jgi:hypothetical protein
VIGAPEHVIRGAYGEKHNEPGPQAIGNPWPRRYTPVERAGDREPGYQATKGSPWLNGANR